MISKMNFCGQDEKIKKYLMPEKLLFKAGDVSGEENIFIKKDIQISTTEPDCLVMRNSDGGENASVLLDFGFEFSGGVKILTEVFRCDGGIPEFRLVFGESAREAMSDIGEKNSTNDHSMRDFTVRLPMFSDMEFAQTGYRFIRIELLSENATVKIKSVLGVFTYRDIPYLGSFRCSDVELNDIYDVAAYTCHLNMQGMIWDGIKRDRLVWIGDMHPEMLTVRTVFGNDPCILRGLDFASRNNPLPMYPNNMVTYAMWWLLIARDWYFYTGETDFALSHREYIKGLLEQLCALVESDGGDKLGQLEMGYFLDWPTYGREEAKAGEAAETERTEEEPSAAEDEREIPAREETGAEERPFVLPDSLFLRPESLDTIAVPEVDTIGVQPVVLPGREEIPGVQAPVEDEGMTLEEVMEIRAREAAEEEARREEARKAFEEKQKADEELRERKAKEREELRERQEEEERALLKAKREREKQLEKERKAKLKQAEADRKAKLKAREELRKEKERAYKQKLKEKEKERKEKERAYKKKLKEREKARKEALKAKEKEARERAKNR